MRHHHGIKYFFGTGWTSVLRYLGKAVDGRRLLIHFALSLIMSLSLLTTIIGMCVSSAHAASVPGNGKGREWSFFKGNQKPPRKWNHEEFDDSHWMKAAKGVGYGKGRSSFILDDMKGKYRRVYGRRHFYVQNPQAVREMSISVVCDGPFAAYLNGMRVIRNVKGLSRPNPVKGENPIGEELDISGWAHELNSGLNVLSVQCDNDDIDSRNFIFIPSLNIVEDESVP